MFVRLSSIKMELYITILTLTIVLSTDAEIVHEYVGIHGCSETDGEDMHGLDEEEMWHADFNQKRGVVTLPDFANPLEFPQYYETSVIEMKGCKSDVAFLTKIFKSPPPEMDVDVALPSVGPAVFCGVGLTLGLLGVATGTFLLIKGNNCN